MKVLINPSEPNIILVDGVKHILETETLEKKDKVWHSKAVIFRQFDAQEYKNDVATLVDAIADKTTKKELIRELVKSLDYKSLRRLVKRVESGKVLKKVRGCLGFKIGDAYLQLIE